MRPPGRHGISRSSCGRRTFRTYAYINTLLEGRYVGSTNVAGFASTDYDRAMRDAARVPERGCGIEPTGRSTAGWPVSLLLAAISVLSEPTFVSERVGCKVLRPGLDLTAVCLK